MELANQFKHYAVIKLINSKWKESYEYLSHSLRDGHCGVSTTGVTQSKRLCFNCRGSGFIETTSGTALRPCPKCNVCLYKSLDNSMQIFLALLFSDESSTIALDIMDSLIVINEVQKVIHLYLDHIEPWEEFDKIDLNDSSSFLNQLVYATDGRKHKPKRNTQDNSFVFPLVQMNSGVSASSIATNKPDVSVRNSALISNPTGPALLNIQGPSTNPVDVSPPPITSKRRPDGTHYRPITPLEAIYYHERLDLITHPLIKGLIKWKWDNYAAKHFHIRLALEVLFLILWTCTSLIVPFPVRYVYTFPKDIWRCLLWGGSLICLLRGIIQEISDISYARKRYEDYLIWEEERTRNQLVLISKNKHKSNTGIHSTNITRGKTEHLVKNENDIKDTEHATINETTTATMPSSSSPPLRSHHSQHHPLPAVIPNVIKGRLTEPPPTQQQPIDTPINLSDPSNTLLNGSKKKGDPSNATNISFAPDAAPPATSSRFARFAQRFKSRARAIVKSYYMYYSLNNLFDWIIYILCLITTITHFIDVSSHTVTRARIHMYIASVTVLFIWFRFMIFFRTISITAKSLRSKLVEIKLGELVIMVRMMFDDIIRFLLVFIFLLAPYAFVFYAVFGGRQILHADYEQTSQLCESALLYCPMVEIPTVYDGTVESLERRSQYIFNQTSTVVGDLCFNATNSCRIVEPNGFDSFYSLLFSIFRIALVDDIPIDSFNLIDRYFAAFVCGTYLLFTAILSINIFIGLISNALQTEAFSTVEARFLLERIEVILNYEWRLSVRKRLQLQEIIHRDCGPLQLNWKEINFDAYGQSREQQQAKSFALFRQTMDKHNSQFDTFRIQVQQKLNDIDSTLTKLQTSPSTIQKVPSENVGQNTQLPPSMNISTEQLNVPEPSSIPKVIEPKIDNQTNILDELASLRGLLEETLAGQTDRIPVAVRTLPGSISSTSTSRRSAASLSSRQQQQAEVTTAASHQTPVQPFSQDLSARVTDLQLAVNRLHQDVSAIRQVIERMSPLSTSLILGRTAGRRS